MRLGVELDGANLPLNQILRGYAAAIKSMSYELVGWVT